MRTPYVEFIIDNHYFKNAISDVDKASLSSIKIIAVEAGLTFIGSNDEIIVKHFIPLAIDGKQIVTIHSTGSIVVSAKYLHDLVRKLPNNIHVKVTENNTIKIQSDEIVTELNELSSEVYPETPEVNFDQPVVRILNVRLVGMIKQTLFAVAKSDTQPVLTGIHMSFEKDKLVFTATDSHRMALKEMTVECDVNGFAIISSTSLQGLVKRIDTKEHMIDIAFTGNYIVFRSNAMLYYSRLIEGSYPNITTVKPKETRTVITLDAKQFLRGVDRACLFIDEWKDHNIFIKVKDNANILIASSGSETGKIEEVQKATEITGNIEVSLSLNGKYLIDALKAIKTEEVKLIISGPMQPIYIEPLGDPSYVQLISQVRAR